MTSGAARASGASRALFVHPVSFRKSSVPQVPQASSYDLNLLTLFKALYEERSLTKAARRSGCAVSTVSAKLKTLREVYGDPLFVMNGHDLMPTSTAQTLYPLVEEAVKACRQAFPRVSRERTTVVIAMSDDFETVMGRRIADAFEKRLPGVIPVIRQTNAFRVEPLILTRGAHFALTGGGTHSNALVRESFGTHYDCCLFDEAFGTPEVLDDYASRPHVVVHFGGTRGVADGILARLGFERRTVVVSSRYAGLPQYLLGTDRVALVPVHVAKIFCRLHPALGLCRIPFRTVCDPVELSYRSDLFDQPDMRRIAGVLRDAAAAVDWGETPEQAMEDVRKCRETL